jgi:hypothetical protein
MVSEPSPPGEESPVHTGELSCDVVPDGLVADLPQGDPRDPFEEKRVVSGWVVVEHPVAGRGVDPVRAEYVLVGNDLAPRVVEKPRLDSPGWSRQCTPAQVFEEQRRQTLSTVELDFELVDHEARPVLIGPERYAGDRSSTEAFREGASDGPE